MWWSTFTVKWFILYYSFLGLILLSLGSWLMIRSRDITAWLLTYRTSEHPPAPLRTLIKYFFLFTLPGLIFSIYPFSWLEFLSSVWSLMLVYIAGIQLVRWQQTRQIIGKQSRQLPQLIRWTGAMMLALSLIIFMLDYFEIKQIFTH